MEPLWLWLVPLACSVGILLIIASFTAAWRAHTVLAEAAAALLLVGLPFLFMMQASWFTRIMLTAVQMWLLLLTARLVFGRLEEEFLRSSLLTNLLTAIGSLIAVFIFEQLLFIAGGWWWLEVLCAAVGVVAVGLLVHIIWTYRHYRVPAVLPRALLKDLPTVSVCIPARNESQALTACLFAALASDYPKLEIIVLDDCSQDETSDVVRSFAHNGVRFVSGTSPASGWLGRNQAMATLAKEATSEYLLFLSVDTLLAPDSISRLVSYATGRADMVSVLPYDARGLAAGTLFAPLRYFWQIALPLTKQRVPVSTKCWLIRTKALQSIGGFAGVRHKIVPEGTFARQLFTKNTYRFVVGTRTLGMTTAKSWHEQAESSLRLLYPTFKRQPFYVLAGLLGIAALLAPFAVLVYMLVAGDFGSLLWVALAAAVLLFVAYGLVVWRTQPRTWLLSMVWLPVALVQEAGLMLVSMLGYEFSEINWKGRNVCYPVLTQGRRSRPVLGQPPQNGSVSAV